VIDKNLYQGKSVMVFDSNLWQKNGGDSDTDTFMRKATVLNIYTQFDRTISLVEQKYSPVLVDVRFEHDGRISKGHFANGIEEYYESPNTQRR
jgi:hypothetical protein